jgi:hypothetical protein
MTKYADAGLTDFVEHYRAYLPGQARDAVPADKIKE